MNIPTKAPAIGHITTAVNIVPMESIKRKGILNIRTVYVKTIFTIIPIKKAIISYLFFSLKTFLIIV